MRSGFTYEGGAQNYSVLVMCISTKQCAGKLLLQHSMRGVRFATVSYDNRVSMVDSETMQLSMIGMSIRDSMLMLTGPGS